MYMSNSPTEYIRQGGRFSHSQLQKCGAKAIPGQANHTVGKSALTLHFTRPYLSGYLYDKEKWISDPNLKLIVPPKKRPSFVY